MGTVQSPETVSNMSAKLARVRHWVRVDHHAHGKVQAPLLRTHRFERI
jgi:hypothetical protein